MVNCQVPISILLKHFGSYAFKSEHPPYNPDPAPFDFHLDPSNALKGHYFASNNEQKEMVLATE
jgi:hypothetical protein